MLLISPGSFCVEYDKKHVSSESGDPTTIVRCASSFQAYVIANYPELPWHWVFIAAPGQEKSYDALDQGHTTVLKADVERTQDSFPTSVSSHGGIILKCLDTLFTQNTTLTRPSFIIILESIGYPISFNFLSDCRDFLSERTIPYWLACPAESLLTLFTDDSTEYTYGLKGDAILVLRHMNILSVTAESLDIVTDSCADEVGESLESKLRLCLSLIAPGERSAILYVAKDTLGICFGEKGSEEATVKLISCQFDANRGEDSAITSIDILIRFCALVERGTSLQSAIATLVAQV